MIGIDVRYFSAVEVWFLLLCLSLCHAAYAQGPLTLEDSIAIALEKHPAIGQARASLLAAKSRASSSATAFLPSASVSGKYTRLDQDYYQAMGLDFGGNQESLRWLLMHKYQYSVGLRITQPLFTGGAIYYSHKEAEVGVGIAEEQLKSAKRDVALGVAEAYYGVLQSEHLLGVAKLAYDAMEAHCKTARDFYEAGAVPKVDLLQAEVRLAESHQDVIRAQNALEVAKAAFNNALGRDILEPFELLESHLTMPSEMTLSDCLRAALTQRSELMAMRESVDAADLSRKVTLSAFFPQISGAYEKTLTKDQLTWAHNEDWRVSLVASWDLWQWGKRKFDLDYARAKVDEARHQVRLVEDRVLLEVKQAFLSVEEARKLIAVTRRAIEQAEENVRMSNERYAQSMVTMTDVLDAEVRLANARMNYYVALYGYDMAVARLLRAMGRPLESGLLGGEVVDRGGGDEGAIRD